jgi:hypothetical protein
MATAYTRNQAAHCGGRNRRQKKPTSTKNPASPTEKRAPRSDKAKALTPEKRASASKNNKPTTAYAGRRADRRRIIAAATSAAIHSMALVGPALQTPPPA